MVSKWFHDRPKEGPDGLWSRVWALERFEGSTHVFKHFTRRRSWRSRVRHLKLDGYGGGGLQGGGQYHHTPDYPPAEGSADSVCISVGGESGWVVDYYYYYGAVRKRFSSTARNARTKVGLTNS